MKICSIEKCNKPHSAKGYCQSHWYLDYKYGDPNFVTKAEKRKIDLQEEKKVCTECKIRKPFEDFWKSKLGLGGRSARCKICLANYWNEKGYTKRTKIKEKANNIKRHKIDENYYNEMLENQNNSCAICLKSFSELKERNYPAIDHDHQCCPGKHSCGKCVRGLLCPSCNFGIGMLKDNIIILQSAIEYLSR